MKINQNNLIELILSKIKNIKNYRRITIGLMGVAFKAETDDTRDSLAIQILNKLNKMKLRSFTLMNIILIKKHINWTLL